jgi:hypothetical protein
MTTFKQLGPRIPTSLYKRLKLMCIDDGTTINQVVLKAIEEVVEAYEDDKEHQPDKATIPKQEEPDDEDPSTWGKNNPYKLKKISGFDIE